MAMSLRGYCRTLRERIDWRPAIRITRFTTIARTGRLTKRSVNLLCMATVLFFSVLLPPFPVRREGREESAWPDYSRTPHPIPPHVGGGKRCRHPGPAWRLRLVSQLSSGLGDGLLPGCTS